jgi:glutathione S-transferase
MAPDDYVVFGAPFSLFTRKLEAALRFYAAPFRMKPKNAENGALLEARSGTHQVPVLHTPDDWMLADTTPILALLDGRFPSRRLFPGGAAGVLVHVLEDYRWHYEENTRHVVGAILGRPVTLEEAREFPLAKWGPRACRATGTESTHQQQRAEQEYLELLQALDTQLGKTRYALGDRPTALDTILLGGLRAHTNADPIPDLTALHRVVAWDTETADPWDGSGGFPELAADGPLVAQLLSIGRDQYLPFLLGNARALAAGEKAFVVETYGEEVSYLAREYPERSRRMLQARIRTQLDDSERRAVLEWLGDWGLRECFAP